MIDIGLTSLLNPSRGHTDALMLRPYTTALDNLLGGVRLLVFLAVVLFLFSPDREGQKQGSIPPDKGIKSSLVFQSLQFTSIKT